MAIVPPEEIPPLTDIAFAAWLGQAETDDRLTYHEGYLGVETSPTISPLPHQDRLRLAALAGAAWRASEAGLVHLVQRRLDADRFAYIAIARTKPRRPPVPLACLLDELVRAEPADRPRSRAAA